MNIDRLAIGAGTLGYRSRHPYGRGSSMEMNVDRLAIGAGTLMDGGVGYRGRHLMDGGVGYRGRHLMDGGVPWK